MFPFALIFTTMLCGYAGLPWWVALIGAGTLLICSLCEQWSVSRRVLALGGQDLVLEARLVILASAFAASAAAFTVGRIFAMIWFERWMF